MTLRSRVDELAELRCFIARNPKRQIGIMDYDKATNCCIALLSLLDRAIMGLEYYAEFNRYQVTPPYVDIKIAQQTLADIRSKLGDNNGG